MFNAHIIDMTRKTNSTVLRGRLSFVPRVGDELRISDFTYLKVERVVWLLDEGGASGQRVNIDVSPIK